VRTCIAAWSSFSFMLHSWADTSHSSVSMLGT